MFYLEDPQLKVSIHPKGAELQSIYHKGYGQEYMWGGDPAFWGKHSPLLFPIVGTLKENTYYYMGKAYSLPRHGFARDREFQVERQETSSITFLLNSDAATRANFPFDFELRVTYRLISGEGSARGGGAASGGGTVPGRGAASGGATVPGGGTVPDEGTVSGGVMTSGLTTTYSIKNPSHKEDLWFSVGGHPAFKVPLAAGTAYTDYYLEFNKKENAPRWPITKDGLIGAVPQPLLQDTRVLPLTKELFAKDALVLMQFASDSMALRSGKTPRGLRIDFPGFPFLGIWAAPNADFVCIEPWCGVADNVETDQQLTEKEGINRLEPGGSFERTWTLTLE